MWPDRLTSAFPRHASQLKPEEAAARRQEDEASGSHLRTSRSRRNPARQSGGGARSEHTSRPAGPHSHADVLPSDSFADAILSAVWLSWKAPVSTSPERRWCTNIISVVTQAAFTGGKLGARPKKKQRASSWSNNAAIVAAVFTGAANNHLFIMDQFLQNCKYEGDFFFFLLCNHRKFIFYCKKKKKKIGNSVSLIFTFKQPPPCRRQTEALAGDWHSVISVLPGE